MTSLAGFVAAALVLVAVPGPNLVYIVTRSVQDGRRAGLVSALGVETGTLVHVLAAVGGAGTLIADHPLAFAVLRRVGAGYLAYLGVRALLGRRGRVGGDGGGSGGGAGGADEDSGVGASEGGASGVGASGAGRPARRRLLRVYRDAVVVNVLNPKVILFFLAFLPQFLPSDLAPGQARVRMLLLGVVFLAVALVLDLGYAFLGAALAGRLHGTPRRERRLQRLVGGVYLGLAALVSV
ncbi:LysE family translocator [Streptomyces sp. NPDC093225]|uniref:LysE family translocator n=1 Tax=Streptomyces sp. NPDC093225 TaxID=3366034 RepID=UPI0038285E5A